MFPECAGITPTPSRWRHGCSLRRPGLPRYLTAFPVMPRSHIHGSIRRFHYGLNPTDDPGSDNFCSPIRMHNASTTTYDYGCNTEIYRLIRIATDDAGSYLLLILRQIRECVTWALLPVSPVFFFKFFKQPGT